MMPDKFTDVLGYFGKDYGYIVTKYSGSQWLYSWSDDEVICKIPEYWIDLTDIEDNGNIIMTIDEMIEVLQAYKSDIDIQRMVKGEWVDYKSKDFNFSDYIFRVKPKPMEIYINVYKSLDRIGYSTIYTSKESAKESVSVCGTAETVKFIEVIE